MKTGSDMGGAVGPGSARFLFRAFKRILTGNTAALERMARMDRALGGEYVFDRAFLDDSVREVCRLTHQAAYHLNGMAAEGYVDLYDAYLSVKDALEDILSGGMGPLASRWVLAFSEIGWEMEPLVGLTSAGLAVLGRDMGLPAPDGFAVTTTGMRELAGDRADEVRRRVEEAVLALFSRLGGPCPLDAILVSAGLAGGGEVLAEVRADGAGEAVRAVADLAAPDAAGIVPGPRARAVCVRPHPAGAVAGDLATLAHDRGLPPAMLAVAAPPDSPGLADRYWISRLAPHDPLRTRLSAKPADLALPGGRPLDMSRDGRRRGSGWLVPEQAALLAELGLAAERAMGGPCLVSWSLSEDGGLLLTGLRPPEAAFSEGPDPDAPEPDVATASDPPLLCGGQVACGGVGAGPVVVLDEDTLPESVPLGSVGVARTAAPVLSRIVPRLGALVAEVGSPACHLATVAREYRVPAVFGLAGETALTPGSLVTVDAESGCVHAGAVEVLLRQAAMPGANLGAEPEYRILRRLLRHIRPLNLVDPQSGEFAPGRCRTCHDILHFAHEKAVEHLLSFDAPEKGGLGAARRLREDSPFEVGIVDLGGGLEGQTGEVGLSDVSSLPLRAFLEGLILRDVRRPEPARLRIGDILSGVARTPVATATGNLALAARDYANITLRLGYHFSVVDALVSDRPEHTFVAFRFAGGFASGDRRARRAGLIRSVLERLGFRATRKGDLVLGTRKLMERGEALAVLRFLGALSAYTRQLDLEMAGEDDVERFTRRFLESCGAAGLSFPTREGA